MAVTKRVTIQGRRVGEWHGQLESDYDGVSRGGSNFTLGLVTEVLVNAGYARDPRIAKGMPRRSAPRWIG